MNVFFGKISDKVETKQLTDGYYRAKRDSSWFNGIDIGDYCFMIGGKKIQLWKARQWSKRNNDDVLEFDILISDIGINTADLTSFIYFKLTMHLIIFPVRSAGKAGKAFFPIIIKNSLTEEILKNPLTYKDKTNFRKTRILSSEVKINKDAEDIQLYHTDQGWKIVKPMFSNENPFESFVDNTQYIGCGQSNKDKTLKYVEDQASWDTPLEPYQISALNIYDAFCCSYKQSAEDEDVENAEVNYWVVGATWGDIDKSDEFIRNGEWINGYEVESGNKSIDKVNDVQAGDWIAIKTIWSNLGVRIKAIGKVTHNSLDGRHLKVEWILKGPPFDLRNIYKLRTIHKITEEKEIQLIFKNNYKSAELTNAVYKDIAMSKNLILWGPPGTGKTHQLLQMQKKFLGKTIKEEDTIGKFINELSWWEVIAVSLMEFGKPVSIADLQDHKFIKEKVSQSNLNKASPGNVLWSQLQNHTSAESKTVNVNLAKRQEPLIFDKTSDSKWYLTDNWKEQLDNLATELDKFKKGQITSPPGKRFRMVTFHQSYSYEDFVEGFRPHETSDDSGMVYRVKKGVFREICEEAERNPDEDYAIFIDEINRGNISKIFGELITLIETDKRISVKTPDKGVRVQLPYSKIEFGVPENLYIIGTMNSVDRSVALVDMALRRRFEFKSIRPDSEYIKEGLIHGVNLCKVFTKLNQKIAVILGSEYQIGHSYFMNEKVSSKETLKRTWFTSILPLLQEYLFDDWEKLEALVGPFVTQTEVKELEKVSLPKYTFGSFILEDIEFDDFIAMLKELE